MDTTALTKAPTEPAPDEGLGEGDRFGIDVACWGDRWHLILRGPLDAAGACALADIADVLATRRAPAVDLDLSRVTEIDELGWRAARYAQNGLLTAGVEVRLTPPAPPLGHPAPTTPRGSGRPGAPGRRIPQRDCNHRDATALTQANPGVEQAS